jgi:hypothetical protein
VQQLRGDDQLFQLFGAAGVWLVLLRGESHPGPVHAGKLSSASRLIPLQKYKRQMEVDCVVQKYETLCRWLLLVFQLESESLVSKVLVRNPGPDPTVYFELPSRQKV